MGGKGREENPKNQEYIQYTRTANSAHQRLQPSALAAITIPAF